MCASNGDSAPPEQALLIPAASSSALPSRNLREHRGGPRRLRLPVPLLHRADSKSLMIECMLINRQRHVNTGRQSMEQDAVILCKSFSCSLALLRNLASM